MKKRSAFLLMIKPVGPVCNLSCDYCYYLEKANLYRSKQPLPAPFRMTPEVLEKCIRDYMDSQETDEILFTWQGGEPTLLGIDFFREVIAIENKYAHGRKVANSIQTNGTLVNGEWAEFLAAHKFLVGLSVDGPADLHDHYRKFPSGKGSFSRVMNCVDLFRKHGVAFNTITTVNNRNSRMPLRVYHFLKDMGSRYMQFIPIVEREREDKEGRILPVPPGTGDAWVTEESVEPLLWGKFLSRIFDEWVRIDIGRHYVNYFDNTLAPYIDEKPPLCTTQLTCGAGPVMEHNGDLYACDHYVYPDFLLGNIMDVPMGEIMNSRFRLNFGLEKQKSLPRECLDCEFLKMCGGDCPKHRFTENEDGELISYLHEGFLYFFRHVDKYMKMMAAELKQQRPAENIMYTFPEKERNSLLRRSR
jgi:uncharacterized protein